MPACLAASTRRPYSWAFRVNSTVRVRGTGCRARRLPCPPGQAGLPPLMVPAIADTPRWPRRIPGHLCSASRRIPLPGLSLWPCSAARVCQDRARSRRKGGISPHLARGPDGHLHLMQKASANGRAFLLLAAVLTITQTRRKRNWSPCSRQELHLDARIAGHAEPQASNPGIEVELLPGAG